jgi:hypothetical protein
MTDDRHKDQPELREPLARAVSTLRDEPRIRDGWRAALVSRVASEEIIDGATQLDIADRARGAWNIRPMTALAAGLACMLIGAGTAYIVLHSRRDAVPTPTTSAADLPRTLRSLPVRFTLIASKAVHVALVGDFNEWNAKAIPMRRLADGHTWEVQVELPPGRYGYAFVVDGRLARDPSAPEVGDKDFGMSNSILVVKRTGGQGL